MLLQTSLIWVSYGVAVLLALFAAIVTTYTLSNPRDRSLLTTATTTLTLTALLATVLLLPVDAALVSATTSTSLGAKHPWATPDHVDGLLRGLHAVYYTLYGLDAVLCLLVVPWVYFWYEEYDEIEVEEHGRSAASRAFAAVKYTAAVLVLVFIVLVVGFFVPAAGDRDGSHWDLDYYKQLLVANNGEKALTFALGLLLALGTLLYLLYTAAGLALLPMSLVKSAPTISAPQLSATTASALERNRERRHQLEMRSTGRPDGPSQSDRRELDALQREELTLVRRERLAAEALGEGRGGVYRFWVKICAVFRPVKMLGGLFLALVALLVWVSVLITGIDKAKNSVCKQHCGYILGHINVFQPVNWIFVQSARAFPLDYVLMALLVLLLFASSISGIATVGIRFLWVRIFRIRKGRTPPQALLMATVLLALVILAVDYTVGMMVAPQYATYGTQTFCTRRPAYPGARPDCGKHPELVRPCSEVLAYEHAIDVCTPTVMSSTLNRVSITWPFFGAVAFWGQFVFLAVFLVVFVTAVFRTPRLNLAEIDEEIEADEEESLLASTGRRLGATWEDITGRTRQRNESGYGATAGDNDERNGNRDGNGTSDVSRQ